MIGNNQNFFLSKTKMKSSFKFCVIATGEYDIYAARESPIYNFGIDNLWSRIELANKVILNKNNSLDHTKKEAIKWSKIAKKSLQSLPKSKIKNLLELICDSIVSRKL